jgi:hydrogenase-1 operon protein HyaF
VTAGEETGNVRPLLHELQHALRALNDSDAERQIDLRALPLTSFEEARIETLLGSGEVRALINSLGNSEVRETAFAGIWVVTHFNESGDVVGKIIEVTRCPWLLQAQREDIRDAARRLERLLDD